MPEQNNVNHNLATDLETIGAKISNLHVLCESFNNIELTQKILAFKELEQDITHPDRNIDFEDEEIDEAAEFADNVRDVKWEQASLPTKKRQLGAFLAQCTTLQSMIQDYRQKFSVELTEYTHHAQLAQHPLQPTAASALDTFDDTRALYKNQAMKASQNLEAYELLLNKLEKMLQDKNETIGTPPCSPKRYSPNH